MRILASYVGLIFLFADIQHLVICTTSKEVIKRINDTVSYLAHTIEYMDQNLKWNIVSKTELEKAIYQKLVYVCEKLENFDWENKVKFAVTMDVLKFVNDDQLQAQLKNRYQLDLITRIDTYYNFMTSFLYNPNTFPKFNLDNFILRVVSYDPDSVRSLFERLRSSVKDSPGKGMLLMVGREFMDMKSTKMCQLRSSSQQVIHNIYNAIAISELKGYIMLQFSYMLLILHDKGNFTAELQFMQNHYQQRVNLGIDVIKKSLKNARREIWRCDPEKYVLNKTFVYLTRFMTGHIENVKDLHASSESCYYDCDHYKIAHSKRCHDGSICQNDQRCTGNIRSCWKMNAPIDVCFANGSRRYTYIKHSDGQYGPNQNCQTRTRNYNWWTSWFSSCNYCFCLCENDNSSDIYINALPVYADITNNYVITGLRFVKVNRIIHLQIQEGKLLPEGNIDKQTVRWKPVDNYTIENGVGKYHTLSYDHRSMDLLDLHVDDGHVITGIQFNKINSHINFQIHSTPFDYNSGLLFHSQNRNMWKHVNPKDFTEINNYQAHVPTETKNASVPFVNKKGLYVKFSSTDLETDAQQSTTPYFDTQDTFSAIPVPLAGAGIYFKRIWPYGGFLAPKIFTYDVSSHMLLPFPENIKVDRLP